MPYIDIDIADFISECSEGELQKLANDLYEHGYVPVQIDNGDGLTEFDEKVSKLIGNGWRLSREEEDTILIIINKYII